MITVENVHGYVSRLRTGGSTGVIAPIRKRSSGQQQFWGHSRRNACVPTGGQWNAAARWIQGDRSTIVEPEENARRNRPSALDNALQTDGASCPDVKFRCSHYRCHSSCLKFEINQIKINKKIRELINCKVTHTGLNVWMYS